MNIVITGACGFVGNYLIGELHETYGDDVRISGLSNMEITGPNAGVLHRHDSVDITDFESLGHYLTSYNPDMIYHLAALSSVAVSFKEPRKTFAVNQTGTFNLLEIAVKELNNRPRILIVGSADIYAHSSMAITENMPFEPLSPYAVSKAAADYIGAMYWNNHGLPVIRVRSFNHIGPGQATTFVMPDFVRQIVMIEKGIQEPVLNVGNLEIRRDFTDVRDVVRAYRLLMETGKPGDVYNVCSKKSYTIHELLDILISMTSCSITIKQDPDRMRPSDNLMLLGDNGKIVRETGWKPEIPIEKTLEDLIQYWREIINTKQNEHV